MRYIEETGTVLNKVSFLGDTVQGSEGEKIAHSFSNLISSSTFQSVWISYMGIITVQFPSALKPSFPGLFSLHFMFKLICDSSAVLLPSLFIPELFLNSWLAESLLSFSGNGS